MDAAQFKNMEQRSSPEIKKLKKSMSERSLADAVHEYKKVEMKQAGMHGHSNKSIKTLCSYLTSK